MLKSSLSRAFLCLFLILFNPHSVTASDALALPLDTDTSAVGRFLAVLTETDKQLTFDDARTAYEAGLFAQSTQSVLSFGIGVSPRWLVAKVDNQATHLLERFLVIENSWLDKAVFFVVENGALVKTRAMGDTLPFSAREIKHRFFVLGHQYVPGVTHIYIRVETPDPLVLPMYFGDQNALSDRNVFSAYSYGFLYGIVIALLLYNLLLFVRLGQVRYLVYVVYLSLFIGMNLSYTGHGFSYIWPESAYWQNWLNPLLIALYSMSGVIFAFVFLGAKTCFPRTFTVSMAVCLFLLFFLWFCFLFSLQTIAVMTAIGFVIFFSLFTLILGIMSLKQRRREVTYFLMATLATLIGASITAMSVWNVVAYNEWTYRAIEIGLSIDVVLLSIALAEQFRVVQDQKNMAEKLANVDALTSLYNRRAFNEYGLVMLQNASRYDQALSVLIVDIDHFKNINDTYGHQVGDEVICATANNLLSFTRAGDVAARWGGEEFILLLAETDLNAAKLLAERLRESIAQLVLQASSEPVNFTVSIGVAEKTLEMNSVEGLINAADAHLYEAKAAGRNKVF